MHSHSILASATLALTHLASASPLSKLFQARQTAAPAKFYLQTSVLAGNTDTGSNKHGLYVFSYHTGAGQGMAAADNINPAGSWFYLNGTELLWTYDDNEIGPWPVEIEYGAYQCM